MTKNIADANRGNNKGSAAWVADSARSQAANAIHELTFGVAMTDTAKAAGAAPHQPHPVLDSVVSTTRNWWLLLIAGVAWIVIAVVILRFDYGTVAAIATLFGVFSFVAAANEVMVAAVSTKGWRILHFLLAVLFVVVGF